MSEDFAQRGGAWVVGQSVLLLTVVGVSCTWHEAGESVALRGIGGLLLAVAAGCGLAGVVALRRNLTPFPKPRTGAQLVQYGIYGWMRHPLYVAVLGAAFGWALVWQSWPGVAAALVLALFLDAKARREERWLRERFPDYAAYQRRVRRFIPGIY